MNRDKVEEQQSHAWLATAGKLKIRLKQGWKWGWFYHPELGTLSRKLRTSASRASDPTVAYLFDADGHLQTHLEPGLEEGW